MNIKVAAFTVSETSINTCMYQKCSKLTEAQEFHNDIEIHTILRATRAKGYFSLLNAVSCLIINIGSKLLGGRCFFFLM